MYCYRCNSTLDVKKDTCARCGTDIRMFKKIVFASNRRYNIALAKANALNLSGAREDLKISLRLYKKNVQARNLYGLVLYATGETAEALKQWVIARDMASGSGMADRFVSSVRKNLRDLNSEESAIEKYNQALQNAQAGSKDMAIIQLKKVISMHPTMSKAYNLLALIYLDTNKPDQAEKMLTRSLEIDRGDDQAVHLLKLLRQSSGKDKSHSMGSVGEEERDPLIIPVRFRDYGTYLSNALYILLGLVLGVLIAWFVIVPGRVRQQSADAEAAVLSYEEQISAIQAELATAKEAARTVDPEHPETTDPTGDSPEIVVIESMPEYPMNTSWVKNQEDVEESVNLVNAGSYAETIERILRVDPSQLSATNQHHFINIINMIFEEGMYQRMQAMAYNYYSLSDYENAAKYYDALSRLHPEVAEFRNKAGQCYEALGDTDTAANRYWQAAILFPETGSGQDAAYRYVMLTGRTGVPLYTGEKPLETYKTPLSKDEILSKVGGG